MKKLLPFILILGFMLPVQSADGAVSCASIKSKIQVFEKKILGELKYFKTIPGEKSYGFITIQKDSKVYNRITAFDSDWLYNVWKLGTNNPKCFTNTQKIALKDKDFKNPETYVYWTFNNSLESIRFILGINYQSIYKY